MAISHAAVMVALMVMRYVPAGYCAILPGQVQWVSLLYGRI